MASADVLIESEAPGRLAALGLDYADLVRVKPDLIQVSVTPFGRETSRRDEPATDLTLIAGGGPAWSCGYDDHSIPPIRGGGNQGYQTASHYAVMSALTALFHHGVTGEGQFIDVSMHAAANVTTEMASYMWLVEGERCSGRLTPRAMMTMPVRSSARMGATPRRDATAHARRIRVALRLAGRARPRAQLPEAIFLDNARHRESIGFVDIGVDDEVTAAFAAARDALQLIAELDGRRVLRGRTRSTSPSARFSRRKGQENDYFVARGYQVGSTTPSETPRSAIRVRLQLPASPWRISRRATALGEHAAEVFGPLGIDAAPAEAR